MGLFEEFPTPVWCGSSSGTCKSVNQAWLKLTGRTLSEELGTGWLSSTHPADRSLWLERIQVGDTNKQDRNASRPLRLTRHDGECRWLNVCVASDPPQPNGDRTVVISCCDVTDYLESAKASEQEADALRELAKNVDQFLWLRDFDTRQFFYISPAYETIWGRSCASLYASPLSWRDAIHPDDKERVVQNVTKDDPQALNYRIIRPDGAVRWVSVRTFPIKDESGRPVRTAGIVADVTKQRQVEAALQESEERLRQIAENTDLAIWLQQIDRPELLYMSSAYERITGKSLESLYSFPRSWRALIHPEDKDRVLAAVSKDPRENDEALVFRIVRDDGEIRWISVRAFPIYDRNGKAVRLAGVGADVTEQKRIEHALRESEQRFRELAENIEQVFWIWTHDRTKILYVSPAYESLWGRPSQTLQEQPLSWSEAIHAADKKSVMKAVSSARDEPIDLTYRITRPDGELRWMHQRVFPIRHDSRAVLRWASVIHDITQSKQAEDALAEANRRLRILSRRRVQVQEAQQKALAIDLHDQIGQSLTVAKLAVESAARSKRKDNARQQLSTAVALLDDLMNEVRRLAFSLRPPVLDELGLGPALRSLLSDYAARGGWSCKFFQTELPRPDSEIEITCCRIVLEALTNILRHAKAKKVVLRMKPAEKFFCLTISDDGVGFDMKEAQNRIQRDHLGLVGMSERASAVGGKLECQSAPNRGTVVSISLPYKPIQLDYADHPGDNR
jgi:PAS domain S-box-containing protein